VKLIDAANLYVERRRAGGEKMITPANVLRSFYRRHPGKTLASVTSADVPLAPLSLLLSADE
jgi:hypothetical protein